MNWRAGNARRDQAVVFEFADVCRRFRRSPGIFSDVMPVSWEQETPQAGALVTAYLLLTIENVAAIMAVIALVFMCTLWVGRWRESRR